MPSDLTRLASLLRCCRCLASDWLVCAPGSARPTIRERLTRHSGRGDPSDGLVCRGCGECYPCEHGVLIVGGGDSPEVLSEREAAVKTEHDPLLGGIGDSFDDLAHAEGPLRDALLALPYGDGSRYYQEPGYFANVLSSVPRFEFVLRHLRPKPGERLLDLGADSTWSTNQFARRGLQCTALDISHHLRIARLFEAAYRTSYDLVQADMMTAPFADDSFDIVVGINALHHARRLDDLARNIARVLRPGGRVGFAEPYCLAEADKGAFGRAQIAADISEHVYLLEEWHRAFAGAGLVVRTHRVAESYGAVYDKPLKGRAPANGPALEDLFDGFYDARLAVLSDPPALVRPGEVFDVRLRIENHGRHTWCTNSHYLVRIGYHLYRAGVEGADSVVSYDPDRTALPTEVHPGDVINASVRVVAPEAPGAYVAEIDLVHEFITWFSGKGVQPSRVRFSVV